MQVVLALEDMERNDAKATQLEPNDTNQVWLHLRYMEYYMDRQRELIFDAKGYHYGQNGVINALYNPVYFLEDPLTLYKSPDLLPPKSVGSPAVANHCYAVRYAMNGTNNIDVPMKEAAKDIVLIGMLMLIN